MAKRSKHIELLDKFRKELDTCTACPKLCTYACPVAEATGNERFSPWGKMTIAGQLQQGFMELDKETAEVFFYCLGCNLCTEVCEKDIDVSSVLDAGRIAVQKAGLGHDLLADWLETFKKYNNPYGINLHDRQRELVSEVFWSETPQAVYVPGSTELALVPSHTTKTFAIFQALGIDFIGLFVGTDTSTGISLYRMGFEDLFKKHAYRVYRQLLGFKLIISSDPEVVYALRVIYPRYGYQLSASIKHISEFLLPYVQNHHGEPMDDRPWSVQDNPVLARGLGVYSEPKKLLSVLFSRPGISLEWEGRKVWASGAEEPVSVLFPEVAENIARRRINEFIERGAKAIITVSPADYAHLSRFVPPELSVEGIVETVYEHFVGDSI